VAWRQDPAAWLLSIGLLAGLVAATVLVHRGDIAPADEDHGGPLVAFLLWPYLYLLVVTTQSPAFLDAAAGVPLAAGTALAAVNAVVGLLVLVAMSRIGLPRAGRALGGLAVSACAFVLPLATGAGAVVLALAAQVAASALLGAASGAERGERHTGIVRTGLASAGGAVLFAAGVLVYVLHTIQPLPVTNRVVPAVLGLLLALSVIARPVPDRRREVITTTPLVAWVAAGVAVIGFVSAAALAATAPGTPSATLTPAADGSRALRVMSFNIDQGVTEGQLDLEQIAEQIEEADPDVVVVEEVARGWSLSGMTDEAEWLGRRLGMATVWSPAADAQFGNVVLSRLPISDARVVDLGKTAGTQARSFAVATLDVGDGQPVTVLGGHLQNGDDPAIHDERAASYRTILDAWGGRPRTILLGDLNTYPREVPPGWPELNLPLDAGLRTTQDVDRCTAPTSNQNCPDWIFTSADLPVAPVEIVVDRPDHRPIAATVTIPPSG
jgi:endonuclease/exonuclease/phosphatase family metal-dependent hydrolase